MLPFFRTTARPIQNNQLLVDFHAHLLPYLDDSVDTVEQSLVLLQELADLGYRKIVATPNVMKTYTKNTTEKIQRSLILLQEALKKKKLALELEVAGKYYVDEDFLKLLREQSPILSFGSGFSNYVLFETSKIVPEYLFEVIQLIKQAGYKPVMAHPELNFYLQKDFEKINKLMLSGVHLQINLASLAGANGKTAQNLANKLLEKHLVTFISSQCKEPEQTKKLHNRFTEGHLTQYKLLNNTLLATAKIGA